MALVVGAAGGASFYVLALPLPWLIGAMLASTVASLAGVGVAVPMVVRAAMLIVVGVLIGSSFTPAVVAGMGRWAWSVGALPFYVVIVGGGVMFYLRHVAGFDRKTAFFAAAPGGMGEIVLMSDRYGADVRRVTLVHALRVLMLVTAIPIVVAEFGLLLPTPPPAAVVAGPLETLLLLAIGVAGFLVFRQVRLPSALLLGSMVASGLVHAAGWMDSQPPPSLVAIAQVVIGAAVGSRFTGIGIGEVLRTLGHGAVMTTLMLVLSATFAIAIHPLAGIALLPLLIAYVPGGVVEMALVALALGIDPAFVTTHHVVRIALVVGLAPLLLRPAIGTQP